MPAVDDLCELLETYNGRDKVVRLGCYVLKLWGSVQRDDALLAAGGRLSAARTALRLFDDLPMLRHSLSYGFGRHEASWRAALLGVVGNAVDQLFLPVEKVVWLHELGVLRLAPTTAERFETLNTILWAASLYIALLKSVGQVRHLRGQQRCLRVAAEGAAVQRALASRLALELVAGGKLCVDLVHAVSCLPRGSLWGSALDARLVAALATLSSLTGIALHFARKKYAQ